MKSLRSTALLCLVSSGLACLACVLHPRRSVVTELLATAPEWTPAELRREQERGGHLLWLEAGRGTRLPARFEALSLREDWDEAEARLLQRWRPGLRVVVQVPVEQAETGRLAARRLGRELQLRDIVVCVADASSLETRFP